MRSSGRVSPEILAEMATYLHRDGLLDLGDVIDPDHRDALAATLGPEAEEIARGPDHHFHWNTQGSGLRPNLPIQKLVVPVNVVRDMGQALTLILMSC